MSKLKTPFFSLGARGSIGNTLTLQERGSDTIVRTKPIPAYRYTLPQAYQRWLYEDYAYLWRQQSQATKQEYATAGGRHHLTGFQYWMKYHLTNLPDIVGWWKLDEATGAVAYDSSRRGKNGVITGASPATGVIDRARFFDGLNDIIKVDPPPSETFTEMTVLFFMNAPAFDGVVRYPSLWGYFIASFGYLFYIFAGSNDIRAYLRNTAGVVAFNTRPYIPNTWEMRGLVWDGVNMYHVENENLLLPQALAGPVVPTDKLTIGARDVPANEMWYDGYVDNLIVLNRALDATEIKRWSERRYPIQ